MKTLFGDILCEALMSLCESQVNSDMVNRAMDERRRVIITYHSKGEDNNTGPRLIEIYAYGVTTAGNPVIRAFQPYGDTTTSIPNWKYFLLNRISSWKETGQTYEKLPEDQYPGVGKFNPNGDKTMAYVYNIVDMDGDGTTVSFNNDTPNGPKTKNNSQVYKTDTEKGIERLRKQLDKPIKLDDLLPGNKNLQPDMGKAMTTVSQKGPKVKSEPSVQNNTKTNTQQQSQTKPEQTKPMSYTDFVNKLRNGEDLFKTDSERQMDNLRKQLDNPTKIDLSQVPNR